MGSGLRQRLQPLLPLSSPAGLIKKLNNLGLIPQQGWALSGARISK